MVSNILWNISRILVRSWNLFTKILRYRYAYLSHIILDICYYKWIPGMLVKTLNIFLNLQVQLKDSSCKPLYFKQHFEMQCCIKIYGFSLINTFKLDIRMSSNILRCISRILVRIWNPPSPQHIEIQAMHIYLTISRVLNTETRL